MVIVIMIIVPIVQWLTIPPNRPEQGVPKSGEGFIDFIGQVVYFIIIIICRYYHYYNSIFVTRCTRPRNSLAKRVRSPSTAGLPSSYFFGVFIVYWKLCYCILSMEVVDYWRCIWRKGILLLKQLQLWEAPFKPSAQHNFKSNTSFGRSKNNTRFITIIIITNTTIITNILVINIITINNTVLKR